MDEQQINDWLAENREKLMSYSQEDIFNCDETALFYRLLPSRTLAVRGDKCHGGAASKERITILLCTNWTGSSKLTPLVIGKSKRPRCFPNLPRNREHFSPAVIGCEYRHNKKAWMTRELFDQWLRTLQRKMAKEGRHILLLLDNFSGHHATTARLANIELLFFPANTTSLSQPWDQGIIQNAKVLYKNDLLNFYSSQLEVADSNGVQLKEVNLLQALRLFKAAWGKVKNETIQNCFRKALPSLFSGKVKQADLIKTNIKSSLIFRNSRRRSI